MLKGTTNILEFRFLKLSLIIVSNLKNCNFKIFKNNNQWLILKKITCNLIG